MVVLVYKIILEKSWPYVCKYFILKMFLEETLNYER